MVRMMSQSLPQNDNYNSNNSSNGPQNHHHHHYHSQPAPLSFSPPPSSLHAVRINSFQNKLVPGRVRLSDISPYDGASCGAYLKAVEALSGSLMKHNAAVIELGSNDAAIMRCGLESAKLYFRNRTGTVGKGDRAVYKYRAGRYF